MNDTSPEMERMVTERYRRMTPDERMKIASSTFETARKIIESSPPANMTRKERRLAFARRLEETSLLRTGGTRWPASTERHSRAAFGMIELPLEELAE
jgi:hypothetical protein